MNKLSLICFLSIFFCLDAFSQSETGTRYTHYTANPIWAVDLGFNNFLESGSFPNDNNAAYGLSNFGSRYIAVSGAYETPIIKNHLSFRLGLELGIHNFMFQNNRYITRNAAGDSVLFADYQQDFQEDLEKSKLVVSYLSLPASFRIHIGKKKGEEQNRYYADWLHIDLGGYIGYRLFNYSSTKVAGQNNKDRTHDSFFLNSWRYGLEASIGINAIHIFARYDLNNLFVNEQLPKLNVLSFGIRVWGSDYL